MEGCVEGEVGVGNEDGEMEGDLVGNEEGEMEGDLVGMEVTGAIVG